LVKQQLSVTRQEIKNLIIKEIDSTKMNIDSLQSEIQALENNCRELAEMI